jgi:hypothetical protein
LLLFSLKMKVITCCMILFTPISQVGLAEEERKAGLSLFHS